MNLFDSQRRRLNDQPELLGRRTVVPRLNIFPCESDGHVTLSAMVPDDRNYKFSARQVSRTISDTDLPKIIEAYRNDPESTLETLFSISLAPVAEPSDRDFARDLARSAREPSPPKSTLSERITNAI